MPLLSRTGDSVYLAQSGIIGADAQEYPNHLMPYRLVSEDNNTETGTIDIVFEAQTDAVRVLKTYKLKEDSYDIEVSYDIENLTDQPDRKSTRLNSSHVAISYAVFCLQK